MAQYERPKGAVYLDAVLEGMAETNRDYRDGNIEDLPINVHCLEVYDLEEEITFTDYDEETGEEIEISSGEVETVGKGFLITWGGPEARIYTKDEGDTYYFQYNDWFGSDLFETRLYGRDYEIVSEVFSIVWEC
jgi:hypothetical protein